MDEMAVREMNASLTTINCDLTVELQEAKDKLYKIQVLLLKTKGLGTSLGFSRWSPKNVFGTPFIFGGSTSRLHNVF